MNNTSRLFTHTMRQRYVCLLHRGSRCIFRSCQLDTDGGKTIKLFIGNSSQIYGASCAT